MKRGSITVLSPLFPFPCIVVIRSLFLFCLYGFKYFSADNCRVVFVGVVLFCITVVLNPFSPDTRDGNTFYENNIPIVFFVGVGFLFPKLYADIMDGIRKGKFGKTTQRFLEEHPDGAIDCERTVCICKNCGTLKQAVNLDMYIPKPGYEQPKHDIWSGAFPFEGASYVDKSDLKEEYELYQHYPHRCPKCRKTMRTLCANEFLWKIENKELKCPICGSTLELQSVMMWD